MPPDHAPLYGPPLDPREVPLPAEPWAWALSLVVGAALLVWGWKRSSLATVTGAAVLLTAPALAMVPVATWGHFPTVDKAGSLTFYKLGAHWASFDTGATATQLIGVSMGHLWVTAALDLALEPFAAMNAQSLLNLVLGWYFAARVCMACGASRDASLVGGMGFGLGLHALRDVNWYTVEKCGQGWLALYVLCLVQAHRRGGGWVHGAGVAYFWAFYYNSYWGVLGALAGGLALLGGSASARRAVGVAALAGLPFLVVQLPALDNASLPAPTAFAERAALDVLTPLAWNRLELWRAVDLVAVGLAAWCLWTERGPAVHEAVRAPSPGAPGVTTPFVALCAAVPALLALGPATPLWTAFSALPGAWRFAKPETFFHLSVLALGVLAARGLDRTKLQPRWVLLAQAALWLWAVRAHPVYPAFSAPG